MRSLVVTVGVLGMFGCDDGGSSGADASTSGDARADGAIDAPAIDAPPGALLVENFDADGAWPAGWTMLGGVASSSVAGGRAQLSPVLSSYSLARMGHALGATNVEATFTITFSDFETQGIGFYVRQNGGYLQATTPRGGGYAVFIEGFRTDQIGLWRERDGVEEELQPFVPTTLANGVVYAVRFRCVQSGSMTTLSAKIWPASQTEPGGWTLERTDSTPALQNLSGGIAIDAYNSAQSGPTPPPITVDDITIVAS